MLRAASRGYVEDDRVAVVDGVIERAEHLRLAPDDAAVELVGHVLAVKPALAVGAAVVVELRPRVHRARRDGLRIRRGVAQTRPARVLKPHLVDEGLVELEHAPVRLQRDAGLVHARRGTIACRQGNRRKRERGGEGYRAGDGDGALENARRSRSHETSYPDERPRPSSCSGNSRNPPIARTNNSVDCSMRAPFPRPHLRAASITPDESSCPILTERKASMCASFPIGARPVPDYDPHATEAAPLHL